MILVAGLAAAGLVGIAAAFYFSIRSASRRDRRTPAAGAARADGGRSAGVGRNPGSRNDNARPSRTASRRAAGGGSPQAWPEGPWPDDAWPDHPAAEDAWPEDPAAVGSRPESRPAARLSREAHAAEISAKVDKPRRRVGFRKGADLDEELWPTETFGGVTDEQFWDDLASDKPLTTTARTAQPEAAAARMAKPEAATTRMAKPEAAAARAAKPEAAAARAAQREARTRSRSLDIEHPTDPQGRRAAGSAFSPKPTLDAYPAPRTTPDPPAERTVTQPTYAATQPVPRMNPQGTASQPGQGRRRRPSSSEEDPLTSAAFALRPSGPVDGRSVLRARDRNGDRYGAGSDPVSADSYGGTSPYPYATPSSSSASSVAQTVSTPPYGDNYGHGRHGTPAAPADEPRRPGTRSYQGSHEAAGGHPGTGSYRTGSYRTGSYPAGAAYPGTARSVNGYQPDGYQGNGHRANGNGHRGPYDPRDDYRRLTHRH